jgi:hypothetical protein
MALVYLINIPAETEEKNFFESLSVDSLPKTVKEKILSTKDPATKYERIYTYVLLRYVLNECGVSDEAFCSSFFFDEKGKPHVGCADFEISVSHTDGVAAVAVCKNGKIGVDVEKITPSKKEKLEKIITRFCKGPYSVVNNVGLAQKYLVDLSEASVKISEIPTQEIAESDMPFIKWTVLESALKHIGTGFECVKNAEKIIKELKIESSVISFGTDRYALSVSIEK